MSQFNRRAPGACRRSHARGAILLLSLAWVAVPATGFAHDAAPDTPAGGTAAAATARPAWIAKSDAHAQILLESISRFSPEAAARFGMEGFDDKTLDLGPRIDERQRQALREAKGKLEQLAKAEKDALVRQDLDIMIQTTEQYLADGEAQEKHMLPYFNVAQTVFFGVRGLLDDQVAAERRPAALVRLRRYAGMEPGTEPVTELAIARTRERLTNKALLGPVREEIELDFANRERYVEGMAQLFQKYGIAGYEKPYEALKKQLEAYDAFLRAEVLPRARTDFRLPADIYALSLRQVGIDMPVDELTARASASFVEIRNEMQALAPLVAKEKGFAANSDYRAVIRALKKEQLNGDAILAHYQSRIRDLEKIVRDQRIATLPQREMRIRIASEAEAASTPAPNMRPPRLIGNTGEMGEFILPLRVPGTGEDKQFDDFTFAAASWTLTAHEGRPGHEMQYAANVERGVSLARSLFAFNSTNVEGWALYAEAECKPYEPLDGQMIALQHRLLRAARAFLDPGLQAGTITREEAYRILHEDVCLSDAMATQEVERYTFRAPGQAPSYFCGYSRLLETRIDAERSLGAAFDRMAFNDYVLSQGLLPPAVLRKAVREEFVPQQKAIAERKSASR